MWKEISYYWKLFIVFKIFIVSKRKFYTRIVHLNHDRIEFYFRAKKKIVYAILDLFFVNHKRVFSNKTYLFHHSFSYIYVYIYSTIPNIHIFSHKKVIFTKTYLFCYSKYTHKKEREKSIIFQWH